MCFAKDAIESCPSLNGENQGMMDALIVDLENEIVNLKVENLTLEMENERQRKEILFAWDQIDILFQTCKRWEKLYKLMK